MTSLLPTMFLKEYRCLRVRLSCTTSLSAFCLPMAARMSASSFSLSQGFWMKLEAPARIASTTLPTVPYAVIMMIGSSGARLRMRGSRSRPLSPGSARSSSRRSKLWRVSRSMPAEPSPARSTEKPSSVRSVSSESRMPASSSMMRMRAWLLVGIKGVSTECSEGCWTPTAELDMNDLPFVDGGSGSGGAARRLGGGEDDLEDSAFTYSTGDVDGAGVLLHDSVSDSEAQARTFTLALRGIALRCKEWIVDAAQHIL